MGHPQYMGDRRAQAGESSKRKYNALTRSWRRRNWRVFLAIGCVCGALLLGSLFASRLLPNYAWTLGLVGGAAAAFFLIAWLSPPGGSRTGNWVLGENKPPRRLWATSSTRDGRCFMTCPPGEGTSTTSS